MLPPRPRPADERLAAIRARLGETSEQETDLRVMLVLAHEAFSQRARSSAAVGDRNDAGRRRAPATRKTAGFGSDYAQLVVDVRDIVAREVAPGASILVV